MTHGSGPEGSSGFVNVDTVEIGDDAPFFELLQLQNINRENSSMYLIIIFFRAPYQNAST
jgi:hypothetical protein